MNLKIKEDRIFKFFIVFVLFITGFTINSCTSSRYTSVQKKVVIAKKVHRSPRAVQIPPYECSCYQTAVIKHSLIGKEYGPSYAKRENSRLKEALN